ncbi:MAG: MarR family transcriptional regulator [Pseudomonadota bacterium]
MQDIQPDFYDAENYTPEESVSYLMKGALQAFYKSTDNEMQRFDLTGKQWAPLLLIAKGCCDTVASCARASYSDSGAMTRMLDRLEAKGLLRRVRSVADRRVVNLELTDAGRAISQQIPLHLVKVLNQHLRGFDAAELTQLKALLRRFAANGADANRAAMLTA